MPTDLPIEQTYAPHILVIDADTATAEGLRSAFAGGELRIETIGSGTVAAARLPEDDFDLVILDLDLPDRQGLELLRLIVNESTKPVIVVTARPAKVSSVICLELGADDYILKPADPDELNARIRAVLRRQGAEVSRGRILAEPPQAQLSGKVVFAGWRFDMITFDLFSPRNEQVHITTMEASLLRYFVSQARRSLDRTQINREVHGSDTPFDDRSVDVLVKKLRAKLAAHAPGLIAIKSVRGIGYMFCLDVRPANP